MQALPVTCLWLVSTDRTLVTLVSSCAAITVVAGVADLRSVRCYSVDIAFEAEESCWTRQAVLLADVRVVSSGGTI